jgi:L-fucose mutarotase/ribose pyranase (RbsD/FucU family)
MDKMIIADAQYNADELTGNAVSINAVIDGVTMSVPLDPANRHYAEIMRQVEAGSLTIQAAD